MILGGDQKGARPLGTRLCCVCVRRRLIMFSIILLFGPVHTTLEDAALFLGLSLPSILIRHGNGAFRKRSSNRRNLKMLAARFRADGKNFESVDLK